MEVTRLFDLLAHSKKAYKPKKDMLAHKENGQWTYYSIDQYIEAANNVSYALLSLGIKPGDKVATISASRSEWNFMDMGIMQIGAIHVPLYPNIAAEEYHYILKHSESKILVVSGKDSYRKIEPILPETSIEQVFTFKEIEGCKPFRELLELGKANPQPEKVDEIKRTIREEDIATIIYTSGTTGMSKGVMLSHKNILCNVFAVQHIPSHEEIARALSFLPLSHVYERMIVYLYHYLGYSIYYAESPVLAAETAKEVRPEIMTMVPRLLEKIYDKIIATGQKLPWYQKGIFFWAVNLGFHYEISNKKRLGYNLQLQLARKLVFDKWKAALGGNVKIVVSGGAAIPPRLAKIYWAAGVPVLEGYGLTETSPVIAVNSFDKNGFKFGTVGQPIRFAEVRIDDDGEILCKGPCVMQGYFKDPELTAEVIDSEGWFHTGDLGKVEPEGQLKITGRKKLLFKSSFGKYINPEVVETKFKESPFIDNLIVLGENERYVGALIIPDFTYLKEWCAQRRISFSDNKDLVFNKIIQKRIQKEVDKYNKLLGSAEQIRSYELLDTEWNVETGELTASLKLRRVIINERYKDRIVRLFNKKIGSD